MLNGEGNCLGDEAAVSRDWRRGRCSLGEAEGCCGWGGGRTLRNALPVGIGMLALAGATNLRFPLPVEDGGGGAARGVPNVKVLL